MTNTSLEPAPAPAAAKNPWLPALLLFLVAFLVFLPIVKNGFVNHDDPEYVTDNVHVKNGLTWDSFKWAFAFHGANWHPVTNLSHLLDGRFFGLKPWGHHLGNVLLHAANTALVFLLFFRLTQLEVSSFFVALLFGLHPLRVESVAWASERKDVLSGFFFLLTLLAYARYALTAKTPGPKPKLYYVLALLLFALGLMSKSMLVTTPLILLLMDYWPLGRLSKSSVPRLLAEKIPFFILTAAFCVIAFTVQAHGSAMSTTVGLRLRLFNAVVSYCSYLGKIVWPANLSPIYPFPAAIPLIEVAAAAAFLFAITAFLIVLWKVRPALLVGWLWYLIMLVPVIGLVKIGDQSIADRYTYLPSIGIMLMFVWIGRILIQNSRRAAIACSGLGLACAVACAALTQRQIAFWHDTESMFRRAVDTTQNNTLAQVGLAISLADRGQLDDAIRLYRLSLKTSPHYFESHYNLGLALVKQGKFDDAITEFHAALESRPREPHALISLGVALAQSGHRDDALAAFQEAAIITPSDPLLHANIAKILSADDSRLAEAIDQFYTAQKLQPDDAECRCNLSALLMRQHRYPEAIVQLQAAIQLAPASADNHNNLGSAFCMSGHLDDGIAEFQTALKLNPDYTQARQNLARALAMKNSP